MTQSKLLTLRQMRSGQSGLVVRIDGGAGLASRLSALGLRPGKKVTKVSSMLMRGPVTVQIGTMRVAIGFGMAGKIVVEAD
jgi:ferrous iron transport protein A